MNAEQIKRMDEVVALKRRIKALGMTVKGVCAICDVHPTTFSAWGTGRVRSIKWDDVCEFVSKREKTSPVPSPSRQ